ncbi:MAG: RnfH family protein [Lysobacteraceae bacterium]
MPDETIRVELVYALPQHAWSMVLEMRIGTTASEALAGSGFAAFIPGFDAAQLGYAIFGKPISAATLLRDGDRLELLRPLNADPKQARRRRANNAE